jgi:hypothetical protein
MNKLFILVVIITTLCTSGCMHAVRYDDVYRGKVYDGETKEPIEGAVVLGVWYKVSPSPGGAVDYYYDSKETVTDKNGEFSIAGMGLRVLSNLTPMSVMVFKAGYSAEESSTWESIKTIEEYEGPVYAKIIDKETFPYKGKFTKDYISYMDENGIANFPLKKLALKERRTPGLPSVPEGKIPLMMNEINKDRIEAGLRPFRIQGDKK